MSSAFDWNQLPNKTDPYNHYTAADKMCLSPQLNPDALSPL